MREASVGSCDKVLYACKRSHRSPIPVKPASRALYALGYTRNSFTPIKRRDRRNRIERRRRMTSGNHIFKVSGGACVSLNVELNKKTNPPYDRSIPEGCVCIFMFLCSLSIRFLFNWDISVFGKTPTDFSRIYI